jgi:hypothetical protein
MRAYVPSFAVTLESRLLPDRSAKRWGEPRRRPHVKPRRWMEINMTQLRKGTAERTGFINKKAKPMSEQLRRRLDP